MIDQLWELSMNDLEEDTLVWPPKEYYELRDPNDFESFRTPKDIHYKELTQYENWMVRLKRWDGSEKKDSVTTIIGTLTNQGKTIRTLLGPSKDIPIQKYDSLLFYASDEYFFMVE